MPLLWVSCAFLCGVMLGIRLDLGGQVWLALACLFFILSLFEGKLIRSLSLWKRLRRFVPLSVGVILLFLCLGGLRFRAADQRVWHEDDLAWYNDRGEVLVTGWVSAAPDRREDMTVYQINAI